MGEAKRRKQSGKGFGQQAEPVCEISIGNFFLSAESPSVRQLLQGTSGIVDVGYYCPFTVEGRNLAFMGIAWPSLAPSGEIRVGAVVLDHKDANQGSIAAITRAYESLRPQISRLVAKEFKQFWREQ